MKYSKRLIAVKLSWIHYTSYLRSFISSEESFLVTRLSAKITPVISDGPLWSYIQKCEAWPIREQFQSAIVIPIEGEKVLGITICSTGWQHTR